MPNNPTPAPPADDLAEKCRERAGGHAWWLAEATLLAAADELDRLKAEHENLKAWEGTADADEAMLYRIDGAAHDYFKSVGRPLASDVLGEAGMALFEEITRLAAEVDRLATENARLSAVEQAHRELKELVCHCQIHSGYKDCGFMQMTTDEKRLYCQVIGADFDERLAEHTGTGPDRGTGTGEG